MSFDIRCISSSTSWSEVTVILLSVVASRDMVMFSSVTAAGTIKFPGMFGRRRSIEFMGVTMFAG